MHNNEEDNATQQQILGMIKESWKDFKIYYKSEKERYSKEGVDGYLVCWKEDDIVLQLSRFFYNRLNNSSLKNKGIEMHSQTEISENKFDEEYDFNKKLSELNKRLGRKKGPKPDFIITNNYDTHILWLVGEVKYFRLWQYEDGVQKDVAELKALKDLNICKNVVYLLADDYLHENSKNDWLKLLDVLKKEKSRLDYLDLIIMCTKKTDECRNRDFVFGG